MSSIKIRSARFRGTWQRFQNRIDKYSKYILVGTPLAVLALVLGLPILFNIYASFFSWSGTGWPTDFVWFQNYINIIQNETIIRSVINTAIWTVGMVVVPPAVGLGLALLVDGVRGERIFKTLFIVPWAISFVAVAEMWRLMYASPGGVVNTVLVMIGFDQFTRAWLGTPWVNTFAMMVAQGWLQSMTAMIIYLAGLNSIPGSLIEAGKIDGFSRIQQFRYVTLPMLKPFTTLIIAVILFNTLKVFGIIWVMTQGGPFFTSETLAVTMYRVAFSQFQFGAGAAIANVLTLLIITVTVFYLRYNIGDEVEH